MAEPAEADRDAPGRGRAEVRLDRPRPLARAERRATRRTRSRRRRSRTSPYRGARWARPSAACCWSSDLARSAPPRSRTPFACLTSLDAISRPEPALWRCSRLLDSFISERSAYFQLRFLGRIAEDEDTRVPVFSAGSFSDQLYPAGGAPPDGGHAALDRRPTTRSRSTTATSVTSCRTRARNGPTCACDGPAHARSDNYKRGFNQTPRQFKRFGVATRLNRFLDHYARPPGNPRQPGPDVRRDGRASDLLAERERSVAAGPAG